MHWVVAEPLRDRREEGLAPVLAWAQANLARRAAMSPRTFARQFVRQNGMTPHQWLMHQRVLAAQRRLEKTGESIDQVAAAVGLESAATLRVHFARAGPRWGVCISFARNLLRHPPCQ